MQNNHRGGKSNVQYPKKMQMRFIVKKPPIHIAENCVGLKAQIFFFFFFWGGGLERKRKVGKKEKN